MIALDSSAVLAVALREPGADVVMRAIPQSVLSAANLAEVLIVAERKGGNAETAYRDILDLGLHVVSATHTQARIAAQISGAYPKLNLSLGDKLCLALALDIGAEVLTSDREMTKVGLDLTIRMFR